jgi:hypothetical protein
VSDTTNFSLTKSVVYAGRFRSFPSDMIENRIFFNFGSFSRGSCGYLALVFGEENKY